MLKMVYFRFLEEKSEVNFILNNMLVLEIIVLKDEDGKNMYIEVNF